MQEEIKRSPFFYVGDKYKLMPQLRELFPNKISTYVEPFVGGGSSFLNIKSDRILVNDLDSHIIELHKFLTAYSDRKEILFQNIFELIDKYKLSCSYIKKTVPEELKIKFKKTYYSHYNKKQYAELKKDFNHENKTIYLYLLLIYGFNHMIRFNGRGEFNLPVGNVDFNKNVYNSLINYLEFMKNNNVEFYNLDFLTFIESIKLDKDCYIYFDPPYFISDCEYNKLWNEEDEYRLYNYLDKLNKKNVRFGITNLINHKGKINSIFIDWSKKYKIFNIKSNYISFNDNTIKADSREVFVTNYEK